MKDLMQNPGRFTLGAAAMWHHLPPAFVAPDLYRNLAQSMDHLEPASEWDEQMLRVTRFALMTAAAWALVANDLLREAKLRFYDSIAFDGADPTLGGALTAGRVSADSTWANFSLFVLGAAIALSIGQRLHAVDRNSYDRCSSLRERSQPGVAWYVLLSALALGVLLGAAHLLGVLVS